MATLTPEEFKQQFTPLDPAQVYGNVKTNEPIKQLNSLDDIHPRANGRKPLVLTGWQDNWSSKLQKFSHITAADIKAVLKSGEKISVILNRVVMPGTKNILAFSEREYDSKLKPYLGFDDQDQIRRDREQGRSVVLVADADKDDHPILYYLGSFLPNVPD